MELFLESIKMDWPVLTPIFICSILTDFIITRKMTVT